MFIPLAIPNWLFSIAYCALPLAYQLVRCFCSAPRCNLTKPQPRGASTSQIWNGGDSWEIEYIGISVIGIGNAMDRCGRAWQLAIYVYM